jgi:hypothetical protein
LCSVVVVVVVVVVSHKKKMEHDVDESAAESAYLAIKEQLLGTRTEPARAASDLKPLPLSKADKRHLPYATRQRLERPRTTATVPAPIEQHLHRQRPLPKSLSSRMTLCFLLLSMAVIWPSFAFAFYYIVTLFFVTAKPLN